jgi:hypothetical protein
MHQWDSAVVSGLLSHPCSPRMHWQRSFHV